MKTRSCLELVSISLYIYISFVSLYCFSSHLIYRVWVAGLRIYVVPVVPGTTRYDGIVASLCRSSATIESSDQSLYLFRMKNPHEYWVCWVSTGRNDSSFVEHTRSACKRKTKISGHETTTQRYRILVCKRASNPL